MAANSTISSLPATVSSLSASIASLPPNLVSANLTLLSDLLLSLSSGLTPALPSLSAAQTETVLRNSTWLKANLDGLQQVIQRIPPESRDGVSPDTLISIIELGSTKYDIWTVWAPECWAILFLFMIGLFSKLWLLAFINKKSLARFLKTTQKEGSGATVSPELAKVILAKPVKAALAHFINLVVSTAALVLQIMSYRLFVIPNMPMTFLDVQRIGIAIKLLLVPYGAELLLADPHSEIYLHHTFTFTLLFFGQLVAFETGSPKFFRLAQYLLLQATLEQTTYTSMMFYHIQTYLRAQDYLPSLQRKFLFTAYLFMTITKWITWPQKFVPAAFAIYWLVRMLAEEDRSDWGRFWLGWATSLFVLLFTLQVKFCDDVTPLCAYMKSKLYSLPKPSRNGPVITFFYALFPSRPSRHPSSQPHHARPESEMPLPMRDSDDDTMEVRHPSYATSSLTLDLNLPPESEVGMTEAFMGRFGEYETYEHSGGNERDEVSKSPQIGNTLARLLGREG